MKWLHAARARLRLLPRRSAESRIDHEIGFHIDMEADRLARQDGLAPGEARRRALAVFGGVQQHRESLREGRGTAWVSGFSLDLKLGFRMLVKYPGLTIVGGIAMAFGIWFGAVTFELLGMLGNPKHTLPDGERIVQIRNWDLKASDDDARALYDFLLWRGTAKSVTDLGAYRDVSVNLVGADRATRPVVAAEVTPAAFRIAPARPVLGRVLDDADTQPGAPPVAVVGFDLWNARLNADPQIIGRVVQIGNGFATVVGVMPEGYAFPMSHELWLPLHTEAYDQAPRGGPAITVFGRLAPGVSLDAAQAEFTTIGQRTASEFPVTHADLTPRLRSYAKSFVDMNSTDFKVMILIDLFAILLLCVVCSTVALLLFARAAARETEIVVRSALGATRRRIITQLFAEALVLGGAAAVVGLVAAQVALAQLGGPYLEVNFGRLPFWYEMRLSLPTVIYALGLTVLSAVVAGVGPARKITRGLGAQLRTGTAGGGGVSFGGIWTAIIVMQVALTVAFPAVALFMHSEVKRIDSFDPGFAAHEFVGVQLDMDFPVVAEAEMEAARAAAGARYTAAMDMLRRRLEAEPEVAGVTFANALPRASHNERLGQIISLTGQPIHEVSTAMVEPGYFDVLQKPLVSGRTFNDADMPPNGRVVIVDEGFVATVMQGRNPIGHRIRLSEGNGLGPEAGELPWYEIVGVAKELGVGYAASHGRVAGVYLPGRPPNMSYIHMIIHARGDPFSVGHRARELAAAVDPTLRVTEVQRLDQVATPLLWFLRLWVRITIGLTAIVLLLSLAGIYAVLSFIVARRTREIGVRVALGASRRLVITSIFRRPLSQVVLGVGLGSMLVTAAAVMLPRTEQFKDVPAFAFTATDSALLVAYAVFMLGVCLTACVVPTMRALRVQPTEALRAE
jgi:putative ABC transport system permease protein